MSKKHLTFLTFISIFLVGIFFQSNILVSAQTVSYPSDEELWTQAEELLDEPTSYPAVYEEVGPIVEDTPTEQTVEEESNEIPNEVYIAVGVGLGAVVLLGVVYLVLKRKEPEQIKKAKVIILGLLLLALLGVGGYTLYTLQNDQSAEDSSAAVIVGCSGCYDSVFGCVPDGYFYGYWTGEQGGISVSSTPLCGTGCGFTYQARKLICTCTDPINDPLGCVPIPICSDVPECGAGGGGGSPATPDPKSPTGKFLGKDNAKCKVQIKTSDKNYKTKHPDAVIGVYDGTTKKFTKRVKVDSSGKAIVYLGDLTRNGEHFQANKTYMLKGVAAYVSGEKKPFTNTISIKCDPASVVSYPQ